MPTCSVDTAFESLYLNRLIALHCVFPVILYGVRVGNESAVTITVDIGAARALSELARVTGLLGRRAWRTPQDVAWIDAEQQGEHQNDQSGTTADRDLPASASAAATHLRRIKLGTLVVFHISPTANLNSPASVVREQCPNGWVAALIGSIVAVAYSLYRTSATL
jgi:hypothetical protein